MNENNLKELVAQGLSAMQAGSAVMVPWPISTDGDMMVTMPSPPMKTQAFGLNISAAAAGNAPSNEPNVTATPTAPDDTRKLRRERACVWIVMIRPPLRVERLR